MSDFTCYVGEQIKKIPKSRKDDSAGSGRCHPIKSRATHMQIWKRRYLRWYRNFIWDQPNSPGIYVPAYHWSSWNSQWTVQCTGKRTKSHFSAQRLYFYFYDGRYQRTKDGVIDIYEKKGESGKYEATLTICSVSANGRSSEIFYTGKVLYSDMLIRFPL